MSSIIQFISLNVQIRSEEIERVTKRESAIWQPDCFNMMLKSENVKVCLVLHFRVLFLRLPFDHLLRLRISKREKNVKIG